MYAAQAAQSESAASGAQAEPAGGDDVVDAEFEEVKDDKK
jgi:molecular chaperone DnaK